MSFRCLNKVTNNYFINNYNFKKLLFHSGKNIRPISINEYEDFRVESEDMFNTVFSSYTNAINYLKISFNTMCISNLDGLIKTLSCTRIKSIGTMVVIWRPIDPTYYHSDIYKYIRIFEILFKMDILNLKICTNNFNSYLFKAIKIGSIKINCKHILFDINCHHGNNDKFNETPFIILKDSKSISRISLKIHDMITGNYGLEKPYYLILRILRMFISGVISKNISYVEIKCHEKYTKEVKKTFFNIFNMENPNGPNILIKVGLDHIVLFQ